MILNSRLDGESVTDLKYWLVAALAFALYGCGGEQEPGAGQAAVSEAASASTAMSGQQVYQNFCFSCHTPGVSGAPKLGDGPAWAPRIAKGEALLLQATIDGIPPAMPPMGMCFNCSEDDLAAAIDYMVQASQ